MGQNCSTHESLFMSHTVSLSQSTVFCLWLNTWAQRDRTWAAGGNRSPGIWSRSCAGWRTTWGGREGRAWGSARSSPGKQEGEFSEVKGIHARRLAGAARCNSVTARTMKTFKTRSEIRCHGLRGKECREEDSAAVVKSTRSSKWRNQSAPGSHISTADGTVRSLPASHSSEHAQRRSPREPRGAKSNLFSPRPSKKPSGSFHRCFMLVSGRRKFHLQFLLLLTYSPDLFLLKFQRYLTIITIHFIWTPKDTLQNAIKQ